MAGDLLGSLCSWSPRDGPALSSRPAVPHRSFGERARDGKRMELNEGPVTLEVPQVRVQRAKTFTTGWGFESST